jgi:Raf kinase inhibitor-like YbhB/YbcL family protein
MLQKVPAFVGYALRNARPGMEKLSFYRAELAAVPESIRVSSPAFADGGKLPERFTADGAGISPPLQWWGVPAAAKAAVLLVEDADSPTPSPLVHAIAIGFLGSDHELFEAETERGAHAEKLSFGKNSALNAAWMPPDPPPGHGPHRYAFQIYALNQQLSFDRQPGRSELLAAINGHVIAKGCLTGIYERD